VTALAYSIDEDIRPVDRKVNIIQGEFVISGEPEVVLTTLLGSCVAACLRDPVSGIGGMNHFLLPGEAGTEGLRYGVHAMELLMNGLLKRGARRERLEAKLFGGARLSDHLADVGDQNAAFAERFMREEGVRVVGGSLRGEQARRLQFWPASGRARQALLSRSEDRVFTAERQRQTEVVSDHGSLELF
jgi:chemotaxis protein CheD